MSTVQSLCDETGVTYRQANHWISKGYITEIPSAGSGYPLTLNGKQSDIFRAMAAFVKAGIKPEVASEHAIDFINSGVLRYTSNVSNYTHVVTVTIHEKERVAAAQLASASG